MRVAPGDRLDSDDSLVERLVRELEAADHVAHGADPGRAGAQQAVDDDHPAVDDDPGLLDTDVLDVRRTADRHQEHLGLEPLLRAVVAGNGHGDSALIALHRLEIEAVPGQTGDPACLELAAQFDPDIERPRGARGSAASPQG